MVDAVNELKQNGSVLLLVPSIKYNETVYNVAKQLADKKVCYVSLNKTAEAVKSSFKDHGIDSKGMAFVDGISRSLNEGPMQSGSTYFVSSPGELTEMSIVIHELLSKKFDYLIFDSLSNLFVYQKKEPVIKFVSLLVNRVRESGTKAIFYAVKIAEDDAAIQQTSMFVDKVIDIGEEK